MSHILPSFGHELTVLRSKQLFSVRLKFFPHTFQLKSVLKRFTYFYFEPQKIDFFRLVKEITENPMRAFFFNFQRNE